MVPLVPEPLPDLPAASEDRELDVTLDEAAPPLSENTEADGEKGAGTSRQESQTRGERAARSTLYEKQKKMILIFHTSPFLPPGPGYLNNLVKSLRFRWDRFLLTPECSFPQRSKLDLLNWRNFWIESGARGTSGLSAKLWRTFQRPGQTRSRRGTQPSTQAHWVVKRWAASFLLNSTKLPTMVGVVPSSNLHPYHTVKPWNSYCIIILGPETWEHATAADTRLPGERSRRQEDRKKRVNFNFSLQHSREGIFLYTLGHTFTLLNKTVWCPLWQFRWIFT